MTKNVSVNTKSTQEKEKNIDEEKNKEYEAMRERVRTFKFFENLSKEYEEKYNSMEKIIREGEHSETREKYIIGLRAKFDIHFEYFEISKRKDPDFNDECVYTSREFFFRKNIITDDEKKEIDKFEQNILNKYYYSK